MPAPLTAHSHYQHAQIPFGIRQRTQRLKPISHSSELVRGHQSVAFYKVWRRLIRDHRGKSREWSLRDLKLAQTTPMNGIIRAKAHCNPDPPRVREIVSSQHPHYPIYVLVIPASSPPVTASSAPHEGWWCNLPILWTSPLNLARCWSRLQRNQAALLQVIAQPCKIMCIRRPLKLRQHQVRQRSGSYVYTKLFCGQDQLLFHRVTLRLLTAYLNSGVLTSKDMRIKKLTAAEFREVSDKGITNGSTFGRIYNKEPNKHRIRLDNFLSCRRRLKSRPIRTDLFHPECYWAYYLEIIRTRYLQHSKQVVNYGPLCERS